MLNPHFSNRGLGFDKWWIVELKLIFLLYFGNWNSRQIESNNSIFLQKMNHSVIQIRTKLIKENTNIKFHSDFVHFTYSMSVGRIKARACNKLAEKIKTPFKRFDSSAFSRQFSGSRGNEAGARSVARPRARWGLCRRRAAPHLLPYDLWAWRKNGQNL